jgi:GAF domain-containing protein/HAMP domain-containing protein
LAVPAAGAILLSGYVLLFLLALYGARPEPPYYLLVAASGALGLFLLVLPTGRMLRRNESSRAMLMNGLGAGIFFFLLNVAWPGFTLVSIFGVWLPFVLFYAFLRNWRQLRALMVIGLIFSGLIAFTGARRLMEPASLADPAVLPAILLTIFVVVAFVTLAVTTHLVRFPTVASRLTVTLVAVTLFPALATMLVVSIQSYRHDQELILEAMDSVATQKISQIDQAVTRMENDMDAARLSPETGETLSSILTEPPSSPAQRQSLAAAQAYFDPLLAGTDLYQEVLLLDLEGEVVYSSSPNHEALSFKQAPFYLQALSNPYSTTVTNIPEFGAPAFVLAKPVLLAGRTIGELLFVSDYSAITEITEKPSGSRQEGETYLVAEDFRPLTTIQGSAAAMSSEAADNAITGQQAGSGIYANYAGATVLGTYHWVPALRAALITEQSAQRPLVATFVLIANVLIVGLFAIVLAIVSVVLTSRTITNPITELADAAHNLSEGHLSTRADAGRPDELGALAESFNFMAATLQGIVTNLEVSIEDRTRDLQRQALRLRAAAEISRDSAGAVSVQELLRRSAELIGERFGFYHVGIFVLDSNREYLILSAASGEAGKLMLETGFKVRGGETVVATVAQTGSSRLVPDLSREPIAARNSLLPGTRSELGLPLKSYNVLIGVLDVHSDQANAFTDEDVAVLQLMADQLSVAIERTRILQESESSLRELQGSYQRFTRESWQNLMRAQEGGMLGYKYEGAEFSRLTDVPAPAREALGRGEQVEIPGTNGSSAGRSLVVPIKLRGTTIGAISLRVQSREIPPETAELAQAISERLAQALEASWLLNESRTGAERQRFIAEISAKIGAAPDVESILRTTVEELSGLVGESQITLTLKPNPTGSIRE